MTQEYLLYLLQRSLTRNVDNLVISDMRSYEEKGESVYICAPLRTIEAAFEILKHTHSILKENGNVIIALKKKSFVKKGFSKFDALFFHQITFEKLKRENRKIT